MMGPDTDLFLAEGEEVVRKYTCTAIDRVGMLAGTVVPIPGKIESEGTLVLTNKRLILDFGVDGYRGSGLMRQETFLSEFSSISTMMSKFGRDLRIPMLMVVIGFLLIFAPFAIYSSTGAFETDMDYQEGYNDGVEYGYFSVYLQAVQTGQIEDTIPGGYFVLPNNPAANSPEYNTGYDIGIVLGENRAIYDIAQRTSFTVPEDLMDHKNPTGVTLAIAIFGGAVFIMGSVFYLISNTTKDWIGVRLGPGKPTVCVKSVSSWNETGYRAFTPDKDYWAMARELGAAIIDIKEKEKREVFAGERVVIGDGFAEYIEEEPEPEPVFIVDEPEFEVESEEREMIPPASEPEAENVEEEYDDSFDPIIEEEDEEGNRIFIVGAWDDEESEDEDEEEE